MDSKHLLGLGANIQILELMSFPPWPPRDPVTPDPVKGHALCSRNAVTGCPEANRDLRREGNEEEVKIEVKFR